MILIKIGQKILFKSILMLVVDAYFELLFLV